jgi:CheY-like chemotaxis protein
VLRNKVELTEDFEIATNDKDEVHDDRPRALVVEDHPVNQKLMILTLQKLGCKATAVWNGYEALDMLFKENRRFDIIFMDCHMPLLDGYATSKAIRAHEQESQNGSLESVPIIALTAAALPGDREKCLESGMNDYITKPVRRVVIESCLKKWLAPVDVT